MKDENINIDDLNLFDDEEEAYDVITMINDDGSEEDYFVIDGIDVENVRYLLLVRAEEFDNDEPEAYIFKETSVNEDECTYEPVEDEAEYRKIMILLQDEDAGYTIEM